MRLSILTVFLSLAVAGLAAAQPMDRRFSEPQATLYELPNFQGRQISIYANANNLSGTFNDIAQSARFEGRWRVCDDAEYRGRCVDLRGAIADLNAAGMSLKISSLQGYYEGGLADGGWRPGGRPGGPNTRPFEAATGVLFPYPSLAGFEIAASTSSASAFCRANDLGPAVYFDSSQRARQALDGAGRYMGETQVLRDVFCRK